MTATLVTSMTAVPVHWKIVSSLEVHVKAWVATPTTLMETVFPVGTAAANVSVTDVTVLFVGSPTWL